MSKNIIEFEDAVFKAALYELLAKESEQIMAEIEGKDLPPAPCSFDDMYKNATKKRRRKAHTSRKWLSRVAVVIMAIMTVSFTLVLTVEAVRDAFFALFITEHTEYSEISVDTQDIPEDYTSVNANQYAPTYIPEGFAGEEIMNTDSIRDIFYDNGRGQYLSYTASAGDAITNIDTEDADIAEISIADAPGLLIIEDDMVTIVWNIETIYFVLGGDVDEQELMKMAESVK